MKNLLMGFAILAGLSMAQAKTLRVIVLVNEDHYNWQGGNMSSTSTGVEQMLLSQKFTVLDMGQLDLVKNRDLISNVLDGDLKSAITLALNFDADAVIVGQGTATPALTLDFGLFKAEAYNGVANLRAILASTGQVIASVSGQATSTGLSGVEGERAAKKAAGEDAGKKIASELQKQLAGAGSVGLTKVTIKGLTGFTDALTIVKELSAQKGVISAERRNFAGGVLEIDIKADFTADEIAALLESLTLTKISVSGVNNNAIEAKIK